MVAGPIVLTTDFGLEDGYVGVMKGVILRIAPGATVVDLCHSVRPQDVAGAAFVLGTAYRFFPTGTVHLVVVDPGVGSARRGIAVQTPSATFVAPDNGVLTWVLRDHGVAPGATGAPVTAGGPGSSVQAVELREPRYWLPSVSATFHGRDVFAPVAAHLARGVPLRDLGPPADALRLLPEVGPRRQGDEVVGHVVHVDHFGNLVTDLRPDDVASLRPLELAIGGQVLRGLRRFYAEGEGLGVVVGSAGLLEVALTGGSAAAALGVRVGDEVLARRASAR